MSVGSPSRMISHTDELPSDYMKRSYPPLLMADPLSVKKVMDLIAKMKNSSSKAMMRSAHPGKGVIQLLAVILIKQLQTRLLQKRHKLAKKKKTTNKCKAVC